MSTPPFHRRRRRGERCQTSWCRRDSAWGRFSLRLRGMRPAWMRTLDKENDMPGDPFYRSPAWRRLRAAVLERDAHQCTVRGCRDRAVVVDHIVGRRVGGSDTLANLRSLCREHDQMIKERPDGKRANGGKLIVRGCFDNGSPRDPLHPWYTGGGGFNHQRGKNE